MRALDHNLLAKSKALRDNFLEEVFLLNNMIYIIENVSRYSKEKQRHFLEIFQFFFCFQWLIISSFFLEVVKLDLSLEWSGKVDMNRKLKS